MTEHQARLPDGTHPGPQVRPDTLQRGIDQRDVRDGLSTGRQRRAGDVKAVTEPVAEPVEPPCGVAGARLRAHHVDGAVAARPALRVAAEPAAQCRAEILVQLVGVAGGRGSGRLLKTDPVDGQDAQFLHSGHEPLLKPGRQRALFFDNQMQAQCVHFGFRIGEVSCPTKYFKEASSINFRRSVKYGFGVLATALEFAFQRAGVINLPRFSDKGRKLEPGYPTYYARRTARPA